MFLTRLGFNSTMVVTGDITQIDLPGDQRSGLVVVRDILTERRATSTSSTSGGEDVVRHKLVQRIVNAYSRARAEPDARPASRPRSDAPALIELECPPELRAAAARRARARAGSTTVTSPSSSSTPERIRELNREHRGIDEPTDVLAFPVDGVAADAGPARARRRRDLPGAHRATSRRPSSTASCTSPATTTRPTTARCSRCRTACWQALPRAAVTRPGFVAVAGRPNVGKSTLVNALVGAKVAVVSDKPQTTRRAIRGIVNGERDGEPWQLVLVDLPGVQQPRDALTERMQRRVERELGGLRRRAVRAERRRAQRRRRPLHRARRCATAGVPVVVGRQQDRPDRSRRDRRGARRGAAALEERGRRRCARSCPRLGADGRRRRAAARRARRRCCPRARSTTRSRTSATSRWRCVLAELVREQALRRTREEVPHSIEVQVEEIERAGRAHGRCGPCCGSRPSRRRAS